MYCVHVPHLLVPHLCNQKAWKRIVLVTKINSALTVPGTGLSTLHMSSHLVTIQLLKGILVLSPGYRETALEGRLGLEQLA